MNESILLTIKKMLGLTEEYEHFDQDIMVHINSAIMTLNQLGVGSSDIFSVTSKDNTWSELFNESSTDAVPTIVRMVSRIGNNNQKNIGMIQQYVYLKVKLSFDPPQNSFLVEAINKTLSEIEWRLNNMYDKN